MTGCMCLECKYTDIVTDNHGKHHNICTCAESEYFLKPVDIIWCECDHGEVDDYGEEVEEGGAV